MAVRLDATVTVIIAVAEYIPTQPKVPLSLLRLRLHTGAKHQLRAHLAQALRSKWTFECGPGCCLRGASVSDRPDGRPRRDSPHPRRCVVLEPALAAAARHQGGS